MALVNLIVKSVSKTDSISKTFLCSQLSLQYAYTLSKVDNASRNDPSAFSAMSFILLVLTVIFCSFTIISKWF